jgi:hypothetical protein
MNDLPPGWLDLARQGKTGKSGYRASQGGQRTVLRAAGAGGGGCCGCYAALILFNILLGKWSIDYIGMTGFGVTVPVLPAIIGGLLLGEFTVPAAILVWILAASGAHVPLFG